MPRKPAEPGSPRWWIEDVLTEVMDELQPILDDLGETLLGEIGIGWGPGVEPDKDAETITVGQLVNMDPEQVGTVLELMASDPNTEAKAAELAAAYLEAMGGVR